jgi:hypothetical protein
MPTLDATSKAAATQLIALQSATGLEHCWAIDANGTVFQQAGTATSIVPGAALAARYATPGADVRYHHSHPDERALSPMDLELIAQPGVSEIWAHTPNSGAVGASLSAGMMKSRYLTQLQLLSGFTGAQLFRLMCPPGLSDAEYETVRDIAFVETLQIRGWIDSYIGLSTTAIAQIYAVHVGYLSLRRFFEVNLPQA